MFESNNQIIETMVPDFVNKVNASKRNYDMHHNRTQPPLMSRFKFRKRDGDIYRISISMNKGEIMSMKGKGKYPTNRKEKPFYNPLAEPFANELADRIAAETGDVICGYLCIR